LIPLRFNTRYGIYENLNYYNHQSNQEDIGVVFVATKIKRKDTFLFWLYKLVCVLQFSMYLNLHSTRHGAST